MGFLLMIGIANANIIDDVLNFLGFGEGDVIDKPDEIIEEDKKWTSPSEWLYVKHNEKTKTIETAYGNFTYSEHGLNLTKDGEYLGFLDIGVDGHSKSDPKYSVICNETEKECDLTMDHGDAKVFVEFDKFQAHIWHEYTNTKLVAENLKFYFQIETNSKLKRKYTNETYRLFENEMIFDFTDIYNMKGFDNDTIIDKVDFIDNKLTIKTKEITLKGGEKIILDPTWTTPSAVSSYSSQEYFYRAIDSIDGDTSGGTYDTWDEDASPYDTNEGDYEWHITYDMGSSECIHAIRIYADGNGQDTPCKVAIIKVCDDAGCSGESNSIASECTFSTINEWQECNLDSDTSGRYIYVEGGKAMGSSPYTCQDKETGDDMRDFHEFAVDTDGNCVGGDPPMYSLNSTNSTDTGNAIEHSLNWTDDMGLSGYIFRFLNESDAMGFVYDEDGNDLAIFYRNGSYSSDLSINVISYDSTLTDYSGTYTIPSDFSYSDILGFAYDSDLNDMAVFFRNGSYSSDLSASIYTPTISFTGSYLWNIHSDFNRNDTIGFTFDRNGNDCVVFFRNGSYSHDSSVLSWIESIDFTVNYQYTIPSDVSISNCIGFAFDDPSDDICIYIRDGSCICDTNQVSLTNQIDFDDKTVEFTIWDGFKIDMESDTWVEFDGVPTNVSWSNVTKVVDSVDGTEIEWCYYANDSTSKWNKTSCDPPFTYIVTTEVGGDTCTCAGMNNNWEIDMSDYCVITDACDLGTGTLSFTGIGNATCDANINTADMGDPGSGSILWINDNCLIEVNT